MADLIAGRQQARLSYRQASEIAWSISWPVGLLYFGAELVLRLVANSQSPPVGAETFEALSNFLRLLLLGFFPMIVRRALDVRYKTGFRIEVVREKADPAAPVTPFGADLS